MPVVESFDWNAGEHPEIVVTNPGEPITDDVSAVDPYEGAQSKRWVLGLNDRAELSRHGAQDVSGDYPHTRAAATTPMLMAFAFRLKDLSLYSEIHFYLDTNTIGGFDCQMGFTVDPSDGSIVVEGGDWEDTGFETNTDFGSAPAGTIVDDTWHFGSIRWVCDNAVGEVQVEIDGVEICNVTGVDSFPGSGTIDTDWGFGWYVQGGGSATDCQFRVDALTIADDEADPLPVPGGGGGGGGGGGVGLRVGVPSISLDG